MNRTWSALLTALFLFSHFLLFAQNIVTITDGDLLAGTQYTWTNENIYILQGNVFLEEGSQLTIKPGTIIRGQNQQSTLIITRNAQIFAEGTATQPIIFTSLNDDLCDPNDLTAEDRGLWRGLFILGTAPHTDTACLIRMPGLPFNEPRAEYGVGNCEFNPQHNAGVLRYVSIRHAGTRLSLGAVGNSTIIENVEVYANIGAFDIRGGSVNIKNAVGAFCFQSVFTWDRGWQGKGQFWFAINSLDGVGDGGSHRGANPIDGEPGSNPTIYNATYIGIGMDNNISVGNSNNAMVFGSNSAGKYYNSIFTEFKHTALIVHDYSSQFYQQDSYQQMLDGNLVFANNIWWNFGAGNEFTMGPGGIIGNFGNEGPPDDQGATALTTHLLENNNVIVNPQINHISWARDNQLDPRTEPNGEAYLDLANFPDDPFFTQVPYKGAFGGNLWIDGWTALAVNGHLIPSIQEEVCTLDVNFNATNITCFGEADGSINLNIAEGTPTYLIDWANDNFDGQSQLSDLSVGEYKVTVTDLNCCEEILTITISAPTEPANLNNCLEAQAASTVGGNDGTAQVSISGGTPPYLLEWTGPVSDTLQNLAAGIHNFNSLVAGTYLVTLTDANSCQDTCNIIISEPDCEGFDLVASTILDVGCFGENTGAITLSVTDGQGSYVVTWDRPDLQGLAVTGLAADTYSATVTDVDGCRDSVTVTVPQPANALSIQLAEKLDVLCNGENSGQARVVASGGSPGYTYLWSNGSTSDTISNVIAGDYSVIVTDTKGCSETLGITIDEPTALSLDCVESKKATVYNTADGEAIVNITGGTPPYSLNWNGPSNGNLDPNQPNGILIPNLRVGAYTITVTDANGCTFDCDFFIDFESDCIIIRDEDLQAFQVYNWTKDNCYLLDGFVYLEDFGVLNIEEGTVIKALSGSTTDDPTSALIITPRAIIDAGGTATEPIIFTAHDDDTNTTSDLGANDRGKWGGLVLLGTDPIANPTQANGSRQLSEVLPGEGPNTYGGLVDNQINRRLEYLSIRHAGQLINDAPTRFNGLTLAGIGNRTPINNIEIFACSGKGIAFLGGSAQVKHASVSFCTNEAFSMKDGFRGLGQFWLGLSNDNVSDNMVLIEGQNDLRNGPAIFNSTLIGRGNDGSATATGLRFIKAATGIFANNIITGFNGSGIEIEDVQAGQLDSKEQLDSSRLEVKNNVWWGFGNGNGLRANEVIKVSNNAEDPLAADIIAKFKATRNETVDPLLMSISRSPNGQLDPRPKECVAFKKIAPNPIGLSFFEQVFYKGAFNKTAQLWTSGWTALDEQGYLATTLPEIGDSSCLFQVPAQKEFIIEFPDNIPDSIVLDSIASFEQKARMVDSCRCNMTVPRLQHWVARESIDINTSGQSTDKKPDVDTSGLDIPFEILRPLENNKRPEVFCGWPQLLRANIPRSVVAIIDSGIDLVSELNKNGHPLLDSIHWTNILDSLANNLDDDGNCLVDDWEGYDFLNKTNHVKDALGHGTHLAGIVSHKYPDNTNLALMNLKMYNEELVENEVVNRGTVFDLICAIHYAIEKKANVINLSLGYYDDEPSQLLYNALKIARDSNIHVVISAGNDTIDVDDKINYTREDRWPGRFNSFGEEDAAFPNLENLVVVAALNARLDSVATYSNYGPKTVDIVTEGLFYSTFRDREFRTFEGTSMSAAHISRLLSIAKAQNPDLPFGKIDFCLTDTSVTDSIADGKKVRAEGKINNLKALECMGVDISNIDLPPPDQVSDGVPDLISYGNLMFHDNMVLLLDDGKTIFRDVDFTVKKSIGGGQFDTLFQHTCNASIISWNCILDDGTELPAGNYFLDVKVNGQSYGRRIPPFVKQD